MIKTIDFGFINFVSFYTKCVELHQNFWKGLRMGLERTGNGTWDGAGEGAVERQAIALGIGLVRHGTGHGTETAHWAFNEIIGENICMPISCSNHQSHPHAHPRFVA